MHQPHWIECAKGLLRKTQGKLFELSDLCNPNVGSNPSSFCFERFELFSPLVGFIVPL
jgi:hypothetical protein